MHTLFLGITRSTCGTEVGGPVRSAFNYGNDMVGAVRRTPAEVTTLPVIIPPGTKLLRRARTGGTAALGLFLEVVGPSTVGLGISVKHFRVSFPVLLFSRKNPRSIAKVEFAIMFLPPFLYGCLVSLSVGQPMLPFLALTVLGCVIAASVFPALNRIILARVKFPPRSIVVGNVLLAFLTFASPLPVRVPRRIGDRVIFSQGRNLQGQVSFWSGSYGRGNLTYGPLAILT